MEAKKKIKNGEVRRVKPKKRLVGGCQWPLRAIYIWFWDGAITTGSKQSLVIEKKRLCEDGTSRIRESKERVRWCKEEVVQRVMGT